MVGRPQLLCLLLAAASAFAAAGSAHAQCRLCGAPEIGRGDPTGAGDIKLEVETSLNFDRLILFGEGEGTALIRPDGSSSAGGSVADMSPRAMVGSVTVRSEPGRAIRIDIPR